MGRKLKVAEQHSLKQTIKDSRGRIAVWLVGKNRWAWRSPVDAREMLGMGQALLEAPSGSNAPPKPTPENPFPDGFEEESQLSDDDDGDDDAGAAQALTPPPPAPTLPQPAAAESTSNGRARTSNAKVG